MADEPVAPRVFFSFAGEDGWWIDLFRPHFSNVGVVRILDYRADTVSFGELQASLDEQIHASAVVVAFVSKYYRAKEWTIAEWERGLGEAQRRRLIFVPIMLDADAIFWWQTLRREQRLTALTRDYQYADFTDGLGDYALIGPDQPQVIRKIAHLALRIREDLAASAALPPAKPAVPPKADPASPGLPAQALPSRMDPPDPPLPETALPQTVDHPRDPNPIDVVVLGHPSASFPPDLQEESRHLVRALGTAVVSWGDGWRRKDTARTQLPADADPVFVQPVADTEAADYAQEKDKTNKYLAAIGRPSSPVALWLPARYHDAEFEQAARAAAGDDASEDSRYPALRTDTPQDLAEWLRAAISVPGSADMLVVQVEGFGALDGVRPEIAAASKQVVDQLRDEIWSIVSHVVVKPPTASSAWQFWDTQFGKQFRILPGSRAIVAVHDLDIAPNPDPRVVQKRFQSKFEKMQREVEVEQAKRQESGWPYLKLFWTALLVNHADSLPFGSYPLDSRYKNWRLLGFAPSAEPAAGGVVPVQPDPASLAVFRTELLAWAAAA